MKTIALVLMIIFLISSCTTIRLYDSYVGAKQKKVFTFLAKSYKDKVLSKDGYIVKGFYFSDKKNTCFTKKELLAIKQKVLIFDKWSNNLGIKKDTLYSINDCLGIYSIYPLYTYKNNVSYHLPMLKIDDDIFINIDNDSCLVQRINGIINYDNEIRDVILKKFSTSIPIYLRGYRWQKVKTL